jgi:hypothetical protein
MSKEEKIKLIKNFYSNREKYLYLNDPSHDQIIIKFLLNLHYYEEKFIRDLVY